MKSNKYLEQMADKEFGKFELCLEMAKEYFESGDYTNLEIWMKKANEHLKLSADIRDGLGYPEQ